MNVSLANRARRMLINIGKTLPFVICFVVLIAYVESVFSLMSEDYLCFDGSVILNTPISFAIASAFEYDMLVVVVVMIISIAIEACKWNIFAVMYLLVQLLEKYAFDMELDVWLIYVISSLNMLASGFFVYRGFVILTKNR